MISARAAVRTACALALAALVYRPSVVGAADGLQIPLGPTTLPPCTGDPISPTRTIEGSIPSSLQSSYLMVPFDVPEGTTQVRVRYCWEGGGNVVDLGIWQARGADPAWGESEFRGWGGSSHPDVAISAQGFSTEDQYLANPKGYVPGRTTRGFLPGPIPAGEWAVELGVGAALTPAEGNADGLTDFRVEIELSSDPTFVADPYVPAPYDETPARAEPGWYAGDVHVHAEHSALGDATMSEAFAFAFTPLEQGGAGLDFITLSDYVSRSSWGEIGRYQGLYPGKLIVRSAEIITYRGHAQNHASGRYVDHRAGPLYRVEPDGSLVSLRAAHPPREMFAEIHESGGVTQLNHVTTCPSNTAYCRRTCRGCPWDYSVDETDYSAVDAIEVQSGSAFKAALFGATAIAFWDAALAQGHHIAAVGSSDSHTAGRADDAQLSPIGQATTVLYAQELSESGVKDAIRAGHTYVKIYGNADPDLRLDATSDSGPSGIMGDTIPGPGADLHATALNLPDDGSSYALDLMRDGVEIDSAPVATPGGSHDFRADGPGRYRVQLERDGLLIVLTSPVYVPEPGAGALGVAAAASLLAARALRRRAGAR